MQLSINIPTRAQIINGGFPVNISAAGGTWLKSQLGDYANKSGVYIFHANRKIRYVGKTTQGPFGTFGERLRRHCQKAASGNSSLYRCLTKQSATVFVYLFDLQDIEMMIDQGPMTLSAVRKALIMEQTLIGIFEPPENKADAPAEPGATTA